MNKLIMVIDDSTTVRNIIATTLQREGYDVVSFPDGVEAMRRIAQPHARTPDLVFLDITLPKMDGYEVARRLKSIPRFSNTVIVMLSRHDGVINRLKARLAGAKGYLSKPLKTQEILAAVQAHVGAPVPHPCSSTFISVSKEGKGHECQ
jgi:twitching motility two-component system response regulator PilG